MAAFEQYLNDKYLSALHSPVLSSYMPSLPASSTYDRDKIELASLSNAPTLLDFVNNTPAPVTKVLVDFYDVIAVVRGLTFAMSWKGPTERSFLLLFSWWALCLYGSVFLRYALVPLVIMAPILIPHIPKRFKPQTQAVFITTEEKLATSLSNLDAIHALRPDLGIHDVLPNEIRLQERLRLLGWLLPPYIALTYWIPVRVLVALAGTIVLTYRAPWAVATRRVLTHSAYLRAAWRYALSWLSGNYSLPISVSRVSSLSSKSKSSRATTQDKDKDKAREEGETTVKKHAFMFTVLENQRWWVGIDWTAALLPSERPSWCAPIPVGSSSGNQAGSPTTQQFQYQYVALPPPTAFPLPASTSVILPAPSGSGLVRKTAKWSWEDNGEWEVLVHKEGDKGVKKVRLPPSKVPPSDEVVKGSAFAKAAAKLVSPTTTIKPRETSPPTSESSEHGIMNEDEYTDQDGWIYGDNKWENQNAKSGMGKFTRFRRWCRVAVLTEEEEYVGEDDVKPRFVQVEPQQPIKRTSLDRKQDSPSESKEPVAKIDTKPDVKGSPERGRTRTIDSAKSDGSAEMSLQQRLKAALKGNNPP